MIVLEIVLLLTVIVMVIHLWVLRYDVQDLQHRIHLINVKIDNPPLNFKDDIKLYDVQYEVALLVEYLGLTFEHDPSSTSMYTNRKRLRKLCDVCKK